MNDKKWYFKEIFKNFKTVLFTLLFTSLTLTFLVAVKEYSVANKLQTNGTFLVFLFSTMVFFGIFSIIAILNVKDKNFSVLDSLYFASTLSGLGFFCYTALTSNSFSRIEATLCISTLLLGGLFTIVRSYYFHGISDEKIRTNKLIDYFGAIKDNYSVFSIAFFAIVGISLSYLGVYTNVINMILSDAHLLLACSILLVPCLIFAINSMVSKRVGCFDAILISGFIFLPVAFVQVALLSFPENKTLMIASITLIFLVLSIIRFSSFTPKTQNERRHKSKLLIYYGQISNLYGILGTLTLSSFITICTLIFLKISAIENYIITFPNADVLTSISIILIALFVVTPLILGIISTIFCLFKKSVRSADFFLAVCLFTSIFGITVYYFFPSNYCLYAVVGLFAYSLIASVTRILSMKK